MVLRGEQKDTLGVSSGGGRKQGDDGGREGSLCSLTPAGNLSHTRVPIIGAEQISHLTVAKQEDREAVSPWM